MKKYVFLIFIAVVVVFTVKGVQSSIERANAEVMTIEKYQDKNGVPVAVTNVETANLKLTKNYIGSIRGIVQADASAMLMEKIDKIHVTQSSRVKKDQRLISLDKKNPTARFRQVSDALEETKNDNNRNKELFEAGAISQQILDKSNLSLKLANADYDAVARMLEVRSPIDGIVTDIYLDPGQTVSPGIPIMRIAKLDRVITEIKVGETDIGMLEKGQKAEINTRTYPGTVFNGKVDQIALSSDPEARNFMVDIVIPNPEMKLRPGMFTEVQLVIKSVENVLTIPVDALVTENGTKFVFIVAADMTAKKVKVETGITEKDRVEIIDGLSSSENIVIEGQNKLKDGTKVIIEQ